jgi:glutathione synthase/RimK-type ligase-like ATP-grasp enzyme
VLLANGSLIAATLRTPPEGGFKSNIGYGGENKLLNIADLPADLIRICQEIDERLKSYGEFRLYSVDFGLTPNGWRMFEANGMPGVIARSRGEQAIEYQDKLTDFLKQVALYGKEWSYKNE